MVITKNMEQVFKALGHEKRLKILDWLKDPVRHFPPQRDGDLVKDGVCVLLIANKLAVSQPTATQHVKILVDAGLVKAKRLGKWTFIKRNKVRLNKLREAMTDL